MTAATLAFQSGDEGAIAAAKASWRDLAKKFWQDQEEQKKGPTLHRVKVYEWLCATEHMLRASMGEGWYAFQVDFAAPECPDLVEWRSVVCACDQGGDGWSALHFLLSEQLNLWPMAAMSHRCWNDVQVALGDAGLTSFVLITIIILNLDCGPWESSRWWQSLKEGCEQYMQLAGPDDAVFQGFCENVRFEHHHFVKDGGGGGA